jgi:arsenate reductase (thioredoxin)
LLPDMTMHVLVLCTHNSARSALAEAMLNHWARELGADVRGHSAGSQPSGRTNPYALQVLREAGVDVSGLRSKSWDEFARPDAPPLRAVITVCDSAAAETCPLWPGAPVQVHWGYADPSLAPEPQRAAAFEATRQAISARMQLLAALPFDRLDDRALKAALEQIAHELP